MRPLRTAAAAALLGAAPLAVVGAAAPASADPHVCAGFGGLTLADPLKDASSTSTSFTAYFGGCVGTTFPIGSAAWASGNIAGRCSAASGAMAVNGHTGTFTLTGSLMIVTGQAAGVLNLIPSVGQTCATGVSTFHVTAVVGLT